MGKFGRRVWLGFTSVVLSSIFFACESGSSSPPTTVPDAATPSLDAATATDALPGRDAAPDAVADTGAEAAAAVFADVAKDFSTAANPHGAWTYGYSVADPTGADASALVVFSAVNNTPPDIPSWYDPANVALGAPAAWRNDSAATDHGIASGEFAVHPGQNGEYAIVRWTAAAAGTYAITLQFKTGDSGDTNGLLLHNGVALVTEDSTSTETVHELEVTLAAGDRLDVGVGPKGGFQFDSTPVHFTVRSAGSDL